MPTFEVCWRSDAADPASWETVAAWDAAEAAAAHLERLHRGRAVWEDGVAPDAVLVRPPGGAAVAYRVRMCLAPEYSAWRELAP